MKSLHLCNYFKKAFFVLHLLLSANALSAANSDVTSKKLLQLIDSASLAATVPITNKSSLSDTPSGDSISKNIFLGASKGNYFHCSIQNYSLENNASSFVMGDFGRDIYPGALIQGKSIDPVFGTLTSLIAARGPGEIVLNIIGGGKGRYSTTVSTVNNATITNAINNELLGQYTGGTPASISYKTVQIYDQNQLRVEVGANYPGINFESNLTVNSTTTGSSFLVELNQAFFTISFTPPETPSGFFNIEKINVRNLKRNIGKGNPPLYVSSVTYGRKFYLMFQSNNSITKEEFSSSFKDIVSGSTNTKATQTFAKTTVTGYAVGGSASAAMNALLTTEPKKGSSTPDALRNFFVNEAAYSKMNPPVPVSYTLNLVSDNSMVAMKSTAAYKARNCTVSTKQCVSFKNRQGNDYITAQFDVPTSPVGRNVDFKNGDIHTYHFPRCYRVKWEDVGYTCVDVNRSTTGRWRRDTNYNITRGEVCGGSFHRNHYTVTVERK